MLHGNGTYFSLTIEKPKFVLLICLLPFLATKGSRVLEKKVNETQVTKTVFSHLNHVL